MQVGGKKLGGVKSGSAVEQLQVLRGPTERCVGRVRREAADVGFPRRLIDVETLKEDLQNKAEPWAVGRGGSDQRFL